MKAEVMGDEPFKKEKMMPNAATLKQALEALHEQLARDNKAQFQALLTEQSVREALRTSMESYRSFLLSEKPQTRDYLLSVIFPLFDEIIENGSWPTNAEFSPFYELTDDHGVTFSGLGLTVEVSAPEPPLAGFSMSVLDVWYGRWV